MKKVLIAALVLAIVVVVGLFFWLRTSEDLPATPPPSPPVNALEQFQESAPNKVESIDVYLTTQRFNPPNMTVKAGERINLFVHSLDRDHIVTLRALNRTMPITVGNKGLLQLNVPDAGVIIPVVCTQNCDGRVEFKIIVE